MCYVKYERYLLAKKYCIVLSFIFKQFFTHFKILLKTPRGTFHKFTCTYVIILENGINWKIHKKWFIILKYNIVLYTDFAFIEFVFGECVFV